MSEFSKLRKYSYKYCFRVKTNSIFNVVEKTIKNKTLWFIFGLLLSICTIFQIISFCHIKYLQNQALSKISDNIHQEMLTFDYQELSNRAKVLKLEELTPVSGGKPIVNVIVTTFRSGSNFMEDTLKSFPGTFTHHETLWHFGPLRIRDEKIGAAAASDLLDMMHCNYDRQEKFLKTVQGFNSTLNRNERVWDYLPDEKKYSLDFLSNSCKQFPFQAMKITRLLLRDAETMLKDSTLDLRMVFLVRDPRGMMLSRWNLPTKDNRTVNIHGDWNNPDKICRDMETDFAAASELIKKYPDRFTVVRYEDYASDVFNQAPKLFKFLGLPYREEVLNFLVSHTQGKKGGVFSTFRDTNSTVFHWKNDITYEQLQIIQRGCYGAMNLWGYKVARSEEELRNDFYPIYEFDYSFSQY